MKTVYSIEQELHDVRLEVTSGEARPPYENPARARAVIEAINNSGYGQVVEPKSHPLESLLAVHSPAYIEFLQVAWDLWVDECGPELDAIPYCFPHRGMRHVEPRNIEGKLGYYAFDLSSAIGSGTWKAVRAAANCALTATDIVRGGERAAFALCRPPGHHAGKDVMGGYCYVNNSAVAAQSLRDQGHGKVAVLDVDYHHGNGTQSIFYDRDDVLFVSIHADPEDEYPHFSGYVSETGVGQGVDCNINYPLPLHTTDWAVYSGVLEQALSKIDEFSAESLVVSLGLDTFAADPIAQFKLETSDFLQLGRMIAGANLPTVFILEGGYALDELGANVVNVLRGFEND